MLEMCTRRAAEGMKLSTGLSKGALAPFGWRVGMVCVGKVLIGRRTGRYPGIYGSCCFSEALRD